MSEAEPILSDGGGDAAPAVEAVPDIEVSQTPTPTSFDWASVRGTMPEGVRDHPLLDQFTDVGELAKEHINLQRLVGGEKVTKPTEKSPPEDWDRFYNQLGRPAEAAGYDLGDFHVPEGLPWDPALQDKMMGAFHSAGLSQQQANKVMREYLEVQTGAWGELQQQIEQGAQESDKSLRNEWGSAYAGNVELSMRAFKATFGDQSGNIAELVVDGRRLGDHPTFVKAFQALGARMAEDGFLGGGGTTAFAPTPENAQQQIEEMEKNRDVQAAFLDKSHPEHAPVRRKLAALYSAAYPEKD